MIRIVKMHFHPETAEDFLTLFDEVYPKISTFPGCKSLKLLRDRNTPEIFFTYSTWESEEDLHKYRGSELFGATWKRTKALFAHPAAAWSVDAIVE